MNDQCETAEIKMFVELCSVLFVSILKTIGLIALYACLELAVHMVDFMI
jgi:hypothetical protein